MIFLNLLIAIYLGGLLIFSLIANFNTPFWDNSFFIWQSISECGWLVWLAIFDIGNKFVKEKVKWVLIFSSLKFLWEIISLITKVSINDSTAVTFTFVSIVILMSYLTFWQQNKANKWLSKHLNI